MTSTELPMACSLSATELSERLRQMADLGRDALLERRTDGTRARLRFAPGADVRARLETFAAAEARCCAFLTLQVTDEPDAIVLTVDAPEGAEIVVAEFGDAFGVITHAPR